ncbi:hypothetical protein U1872_00075 [Sphingomonas sp. RB3P16]|uniref:hypothetical protein n=1 Tax=Parasphingomonas frigoris TaxID=3096163 RepID=UPI002FCAB881
MAGFRRLSLGIALACAIAGSFTSPVRAQTQATIRNTAALLVGPPGRERTVTSNTVTLDRSKRPTVISFRRLPPGYDLSGQACLPGAPPTFRTAPVSADELDRAPPLVSLDLHNPFIQVIEAPGENHDPTRSETVTLDVMRGDSGIAVTLRETAPDSGVFAGGVPAAMEDATTAACDLSYLRKGTITLSFAGSDSSFGSTYSILIDPLGYVFNAKTGAVIDGATVTLLDAATGAPAAQVFGDDGISRYPNRVTSGGSVTDARGTVYTFLPGQFRFPLVPAGQYRLQVEPPAGFTAPSTASTEAIAALKGPDGAYLIGDGSFGRAFTVAGAAPVQVDVPVDPPAGTGALLIEKTASIREASPGDFVQYRLDLRSIGTEPARTISIDDALPQGLRYKVGSTRGASEAVVSPDGRGMRFTLPSLAAGMSTFITYLVEITPGAPVGEAVNRATAQAPGFSRSNEASAPVRIRPLLFTDALTLIGRITEGNCADPARRRKGIANIRLLMEDGSYVLTDRDGLYHFEGVRPGTHVVQIDPASIPKSYLPVACDRDTRAAGSATSRFVEGQGGGVQRVDFQLRPSGIAADAADALPITVLADPIAAGHRDDWLAAATPGTDWLFPQADHNPRAPVVRAVIKHAPGQRVALRLNGAVVEPLNYDGTDDDKARGVAVSRWTGLALTDGDNQLEARVLNADGSVATTLTRSVHYANMPSRATLAADVSRPIADGMTRPLIAVRVTDRDGHPVRAGTPVPYRVDSPYFAAQEAGAQQGRQLAGIERVKTLAHVVGDDGLAFVALEPTRQPGAVRIVITTKQDGLTQDSEIKTWLSAPAGKWVVVGFGRGTIGYDTLSRAKGLGKGRNDVVTDGQLALYAKGRIKGAWLLTAAYDSDRRVDRDRGLLGVIDPNRYYTVYGDGTQQAYDAPTQGKLYLRLERRSFYALYGDFETGLTDTKLMRYSRTMSGFKAELGTDRVRATAFAAKDDQLYGRDEIQGNGLSGPYRLSARDIVPNSDKVRIETRDRYRSDRIVDTRTLVRHIDYDIDAVGGTLRFREPILSRDSALNPNFIVVEYETEKGTRSLAAGGRAAVKLGKVELGASVLRDESIGKATVAGVDLRVRPMRDTEIRAEAATGGRQGLKTGQAYLFEAEHHGSRADILAYYHRQSDGYGVGQQNFGEAGTQKTGIDARYRFTQALQATVSGWYERDLVGSGRRLSADARLEFRRSNGLAFIGAQIAADRGLDGVRRQSQLLTVGGSQDILGGAVTLNAQGQVALGGDPASVDFPARQHFGATWRITDSVRLVGDMEYAKGKTFTAHTGRLGFDLAPWAGAHLLTTLNQGKFAENGTRSFAQYGLSQSLPLGQRWTIDATVDSSQTITGAAAKAGAVNPFQPLAAGGGVTAQNGLNGDFTATTLGATYRSPLWSWNGRLEYRTGQGERRVGLTSNLLRALGAGNTLASSIQAYRIRQANGALVTSAQGDLALVLRPLDSRWSLLERFELRHEAAGIGSLSNNSLAVPTFAQGDQTTSRAINNLALNYRTGNEGVGHGFVATAYYGAKYVRGRYADETIAGFIDVIGVEMRKDVGRHFDIGGNVSVQHAWTSKTLAYSAGPSIGVSPANALWVTAGYNVAGFVDRDFEAARWTRKGPYLTLRLRLEQSFLGAAARALGVRR